MAQKNRGSPFGRAAAFRRPGAEWAFARFPSVSPRTERGGEGGFADRVRRERQKIPEPFALWCR